MGRDPVLAAQTEPQRQRLAEHINSTMDDEPEGIIADHRYGGDPLQPIYGVSGPISSTRRGCQEGGL